jgi:hypothetical protein
VLTKVQLPSPADRGVLTSHGFRLGYGGRRVRLGLRFDGCWLLGDSHAISIPEARTVEPVVSVRPVRRDEARMLGGIATFDVDIVVQ